MYTHTHTRARSFIGGKFDRETDQDGGSEALSEEVYFSKACLSDVYEQNGRKCTQDHSVYGSRHVIKNMSVHRILWSQNEEC